MKNDYSFKLVAVIILAGVIVAFASPGQTAKAGPTSVTPATAAAPAITHPAPSTE